MAYLKFQLNMRGIFLIDCSLLSHCLSLNIQQHHRPSTTLSWPPLTTGPSVHITTVILISHHHPSHHCHHRCTICFIYGERQFKIFSSSSTTAIQISFLLRQPSFSSATTAYWNPIGQKSIYSDVVIGES